MIRRAPEPRRRLPHLWLPAAVAVIAIFTGCAHSQPPDPRLDDGEALDAGRLLTVDLGRSQTLAEVVAELDDRRAIFVGETHTRYDHHLMQLAVVRAAHHRTPDLAIGVEWFQQPFQEHLDDFIAGRIDEAELLDRAGYYDRWRFDYRLYRPIVRYAREHGIPLIALNAAQELTSEIGRSGLADLPEDLRTQLPDGYDRSDRDYEQRLRQMFDSHPGGADRSFERFLDVQLTWDESMAQAAADYLRANPEKRMVILAGSGHIAHRSGIPNRLQRRLPGVRGAVILASEVHWGIDSADYLVLSQPQQLPPPGLLGAFIDRGEDGLRVSGFSDDSPLEDAGVSEGDVLLGIDGHPIANFAALKIALIDSRPGDVVQVSYRHTDWMGRERQRAAEVTLRGRPPAPSMHP